MHGPHSVFDILLCSHSPNDVTPEPQRNVSITAVRGAVRPSSSVFDIGQCTVIYCDNGGVSLI